MSEPTQTTIHVTDERRVAIREFLTAHATLPAGMRQFVKTAGRVAELKVTALLNAHEKYCSGEGTNRKTSTEGRKLYAEALVAVGGSEGTAAKEWSTVWALIKSGATYDQLRKLNASSTKLFQDMASALKPKPEPKPETVKDAIEEADNDGEPELVAPLDHDDRIVRSIESMSAIARGIVKDLHAGKGVLPDAEWTALMNILSSAVRISQGNTAKVVA